MDVNPVNRSYLESLTTRDLIKMADNLGIDIPPDLDRVFIIEELLDVSSFDETIPDGNDFFDLALDVTAEDKPEISNEANATDLVWLDSAPLPKQYNITFIEVIIRDPLWAFVFWEIKASDKEQLEKTQDFTGYYLKVSPWLAAQAAPSSLAPNAKAGDGNDVFAVPVKPEDGSWYLGLTDKIFRVNPKQYKVELCAGIRGDDVVLAVSSPFRLPEFSDNFEDSGGEKVKKENSIAANPLVMLSGYEDFHILRNNEKKLRVKKGTSGNPNE